MRMNNISTLKLLFRDTKLVWIVPGNKRKFFHHWEIQKGVMLFNFVTKTVSSVKKPKIYTWPNPACIFFFLTWLSNAKFDMRVSDRCGHVTWDFRISEPFLDLMWCVIQIRKELKKAKNVGFLFYPCEPQSTPITTNINKEVPLIYQVGQICQKWPKLASNSPL